VGRFFAEDVATPLGLELWIGLPAAEERRVAPVRRAESWGAVTALQPASIEVDELQARIYANPNLFPAGENPANTPAFHQAELPGGGGIGSARSVARLYGCLAQGGELDGVRLCGPEAIALARGEQARFTDPFSDLPMAYGVGFHLQTEVRPFGPPASGYGHPGAGGSAHGAWPDQRVGFSYVMNELRNPMGGDPRADALLDALMSAVG
jgi:CubicO group peptidase (beta-lactamase class C family)